MTIKCTIQEQVSELAASFINGNREYVCNQLFFNTDYKRAEAVAIAAAIVAELPNDYKVDFVGLLQHWA